MDKIPMDNFMPVDIAPRREPTTDITISTKYNLHFGRKITDELVAHRVKEFGTTPSGFIRVGVNIEYSRMDKALRVTPGSQFVWGCNRSKTISTNVPGGLIQLGVQPGKYRRLEGQSGVYILVNPVKS